MTNQRELDSLLGAFFAEGPNQVADRVIDAALVQIDQTQQRRVLRVPWRFPQMNMLSRVAVAAVIGVLVVGAGLYITRPTQPPIGGPSPTPSASVGPSQPTVGPPSHTPVAPTPSESSSVVPVRPASWTATGSMTGARWGGTAVLLQDGKVLVLGGNGAPWPPATEIYDPGTGTWTATGAMITPRMQFAATLLPDGKVLVAGGAGDAGVLASAELYDPSTGSWTATGSLRTARVSITATLLPDGRVLIAGGYDDVPLASAELYDPSTGSWTATGSMAGAGSGWPAVLLRNGKVLVVGATAELYDPDTGKWAPTGDMRPISSGTATLLGDGRVLVMDGGGPSGIAELYDPTTDSWTATGSRSAPITFYSATLLSDGRVLVAGGQGGYPCANRSHLAELYEPRTGTWGSTSDMIQGRSGHTATLLTDGRVLVASGQQSGKGGEPCDGGLDVLSSAELYDPGVGQ